MSPRVQAGCQVSSAGPTVARVSARSWDRRTVKTKTHLSEPWPATGVERVSKLTAGSVGRDDPRMAQQTTVEFIDDDKDGKSAAETISFGLDGVSFEIDLSEKNAKALRRAYEDWIDAA